LVYYKTGRLPSVARPASSASREARGISAFGLDAQGFQPPHLKTYKLAISLRSTAID
jgi:hypothetical protein